MEEYKKDDRGRSKAKRLTQTDPHSKVDSSTWTPSAPENAGVKTGARPLTKRLYKKGGKVIGNNPIPRADRKPRKSGGRALTADSLINRNVREANEDREGIKHDGAFKKGGKVHKFGGGMIGNNPISDQNKAMGKAAGPMKKGGRTKKREHHDGADGNVVGAQSQTTPDYDTVMKNAAAARAASQSTMKGSDADRAKNAKAFDEQQAAFQRSLPQNRKHGGKIKHPDVAEDKALIKRMVKPEARTGRKSGGETMHHKDCTCHMCSGGRTMKYAGGGVFSGNSKEKNPGEVGGRKAHAKGGRTKGTTTINIVMAPRGGQDQASMPNAPVMPPKPPMGVPVPPPQMAGGAPPMGGMPPQMPPQMPGRATGGRTRKMVGGSLGNAGGMQPMQQQPMMGQPMMQQPMGYPMPRKSGGRTGYPIDTGAGGGNARLEKIEAYGLKPRGK